MPKSFSGSTFLSWFTPVISGGTLMAFELLGEKLLAPFYGEGTEVWAVILASTLLGLALGYFISAWASQRFRPPILLGTALLFGGLILQFLPALGAKILPELAGRTGSWPLVLSGILLIFPPPFILALISPTLIQWLSRTPRGIGRVSGQVFALSTFSGVLVLWLTAFWLLPEFGLRLCTAAFGTILMASGLVWLLWGRIGSWAWLAFPICLCTSLWTLGGSGDPPNKLRYRKTGVLGELMVVDLAGRVPAADRRILLNNRTGQTFMRLKDQCSAWDYPYYIDRMAGSLEVGNGRALILGLAGGFLASEMHLLGYTTVDAVDLDSRVHDLARDEFFMQEPDHFFVDDARHFVNVNREPYQVIILDLFAGDGIPEHVLTLEGIQQLRKSLTPEGCLFINSYGFLSGRAGAGNKAIYKTILAAGMEVAIVATSGMESRRNLIFVVRNSPFSGQDFPLDKITPCQEKRSLTGPVRLITLPGDSLAPYPVLTDDRPLLNRLNQEAIHSWRAYALEHYLLGLEKEGIPFF